MRKFDTNSVISLLSNCRPKVFSIYRSGHWQPLLGADESWELLQVDKSDELLSLLQKLLLLHWFKVWPWPVPHVSGLLRVCLGRTDILEQPLYWQRHLLYVLLGNAPQLDRLEEARKLIQGLVRKYPNYTEAHAALAAVLWKEGNRSLAEEQFSEATSREPKYSDIRYYWSQSLCPALSLSWNHHITIPNASSSGWPLGQAAHKSLPSTAQKDPITFLLRNVVPVFNVSPLKSLLILVSPSKSHKVTTLRPHSDLGHLVYIQPGLIWHGSGSHSVVL